MNRFCDVDCLTAKLPAVYGYQNAKPVSLEESLKPIESLIEQLPVYINYVMKIEML